MQYGGVSVWLFAAARFPTVGATVAHTRRLVRNSLADPIRKSVSAIYALTLFCIRQRTDQ
jgi:hypothetical protein